MTSWATVAALAFALAPLHSAWAQNAAPEPTSEVAPPPAPVEDTLVFTPDATSECLSISRPVERAPCIGLAAEACVKDSPGGETAPGRIACLNAETAFWERFIAVSTNREEDITEAAEADPDAPVSEDLLPRLHEAWEAYRDALCDVASQRMGEGAAQTTGLAECRLRETARYALWLDEFVGVGP